MRTTMIPQQYRPSLSVIGVVLLLMISVVALGGATSVAANGDAGEPPETGLDVTAPDTVEPGEELTVTVASTNAEYLGISGDTEGWTVTDIDPAAVLVGNPTELPYESGDEDWYYAETSLDELTLTLDTTVETGEYEFTAVEQDMEDNVVAETEFTILVSEKQITVDADSKVDKDTTTELTIESNNADHLRLSGDTDGWTVVGMDPAPAIIGSPTEFPYESGDEAWFYADSSLDELTIELNATVDAGTDYQFTATELDGSDNLISEQPVTITVTEGHESGVSQEKFDAINNGGDELTLSNLQDAVSEWSQTEQVNGVDITLSDLQDVVNWWSGQQ